MALPDITVTIAIDRNTAKQLLVSWPTWQKYRPEMWNWPWVIAFDWQPPNGLLASDVQKIADIMGLDNYEAVRWPPVKLGTNEPMAEYETQRAKMVQAFWFVPASYVRTEWHVKIDTDVLALGNKSWPLPEWFEPDARGREPVMIASPWRYGRAKGTSDTIHDWCRKLELFAAKAWPDLPSLDLESRISENGTKILGPRTASWICFQRASWTREVMSKVVEFCPPCHLPIGSHDTFASDVAERLDCYVVRANMKRRQFTNVPSYRRLKAKAEKIMAQ